MSISSGSLSALLSINVGNEAKETGEPVEFGECAEGVETALGLCWPGCGNANEGRRKGSVWARQNGGRESSYSAGLLVGEERPSMPKVASITVSFRGRCRTMEISIKILLFVLKVVVVPTFLHASSNSHWKSSPSLLSRLWPAII
jgi:hypothetical protein